MAFCFWSKSSRIGWRRERSLAANKWLGNGVWKNSKEQSGINFNFFTVQCYCLFICCSVVDCGLEWMNKAVTAMCMYLNLDIFWTVHVQPASCSCTAWLHLSHLVPTADENIYPPGVGAERMLQTFVLYCSFETDSSICLPGWRHAEFKFTKVRVLVILLTVWPCTFVFGMHSTSIY